LLANQTRRSAVLRCSPRLLALAVIITVVAGAGGEPPSPAKKPLAVEDLYRFDGPRSVTLDPEGRRAVYVRRRLDAATKQERQSLWLADGSRDKVRPLEKDEPDARAPVFSPDGKWVAFLSTRPRPDGWKQTPPAPPQSDPATDVWLLSPDGGTAIPLAGPDKPYGRVFNDGFYGRVAFSPDGKRLAFVADDGKDRRSPQEIEAGVEVVRPDQGEGYTGYGAAQVWVAHLDGTPGKAAAGRVERLTDDDVWYGDPQWSPDGKLLVVHANRTDDRESVRFSINKNFDLWAIDPETKKLRQLTTGPGPEVAPRLAPDGKRLVCLSVPRKGSHRDVFNLAVVTLGASGPRTDVLFDQHGPGADTPPHPAPSFPLPEDCWDGNDHLVYNVADGTGTGLVRVDLGTGKGTWLPVPTVGPDGKLSDDPVVRRSQQRRRLTPPGDLFLAERLLGETQVVKWDNDGRQLDGVLTLPPAGVARAPYRLLLLPHGGPHGRSTTEFNFTAQVFAGQGYAVFQPNFRGSDGYGQKFIDADRFDFGGGDVRDILTGIDALVKRKLVDPERQFVSGTSYGGFLTCWLVGHTTQFRAAVAQNAVTDLDAMWGLSDIPSWTEWEFGGKPWEVPAAMRRHSPLTYAADVQTPTLILHSRDDRRVPLPQGRMFHHALLARKIPTEMVIYPDEGHGIRQPRHQEDVLRRALAWFARYDTSVRK
jgi:dipeptidyl aminopeptidase/acylaminoacyl peptidase